MATPVISRPTAVDSSPLLTIGDEKPDKGVRLGQATKSSKALKEATADQQDTSDSDDQALKVEKKLEVQADTSDSDDQALEGEKEVEVQADTKDERRSSPRPLPLPKPRPQPRLQPPAAAATTDAAPNSIEPLAPPGPRPAASTEHDTVSTKTNGTDAKKHQKGAGAVASGKSDAELETDAADASVQKSRLPFRRNENGPRKGGKQKEKGALGRAREKLKMRLFGKKKKEPVEESNPYANPITPYQQVRNNLAQGALPGGPGGLPSNPRMNSSGSGPAPPPYQSPSVASNSPRFGDEKYGNQNGYGSNRYDSDNASAFSANQRRPGGYGGFGDEGGNKDLFGGAAGRYVPPEQQSNGSPANGSAPFQSPSSRYQNDPSKGALLGNAQDRYNPLPPSSRQEAPAEDDEYGGYGAPRELTEEEKDEQGYQSIRSDIKSERKAMADTASRIDNIADTALDSALHGYAALGAQDDRLRRADQNLNSAAAYSRVAEDKTKELKSVQGMWSVLSHTSKSTIKKQDAATLQRHQMEKRQREETARGQYKATEDLEETFMAADKSKPGLLGANGNKKKNFDFIELEEGENSDELDEDEKEDMRNTNRAVASAADKVHQMNLIARGMNRRISDQNELLTEMAQKSDAVDDHVRMNREKLSRIR